MHVVPSPIEQVHIQQALADSQMSMAAIQTLLSLSQWVLGVLALLIAAFAIWGFDAIKRAACREAEQIANKGFEAYIGTEAFQDMIRTKIAESVQQRWENTFVVSRLAEEKKGPDDASPFPVATGDGK